MRLYLDTAPAIYVVEQVTPFFPVVDARLSAAGIVTHCVCFLPTIIGLIDFLVFPLKLFASNNRAIGKRRSLGHEALRLRRSMTSLLGKRYE